MLSNFFSFDSYSPVNLTTFFLVSMLSAILSFACIKVYLLTLYQTVSKKDEHELILTVVLMAVVASLVSLVVGANLARAFAIFGVMSIVRFRAAMGKESSIVFIFMAVALGICCGAGYYTLGIVYSMFVMLLIFLINRLFTKVKNKDNEQSATKNNPNKIDSVNSTYE